MSSTSETASKEADTPDLMTVVAPSVVDLRSEFEAQLRAVTHLEEQLVKTLGGKDPTKRDLLAALRCQLGEMIRNNKNVGDVLVALEEAIGTGPT